MARPIKYNLQYFPLDVTFFEDHKTILIEEDYGFKGGYIALRLIAMVYEQGYYLDWKDKQEISVAKRIGNGVTGTLVADVLASCLKHGLFDKSLFDEHAVLSSKGIQKRWLLVMNQLRRKVNIDSQFWRVSSEETEITSEETTLPATFSTQKESKEKQIKKKQIKKEVVATKSPPKNISKKAEEAKEPYWEELVDTWFDFGIQKFNEKPSFERDDPKIFKRIIQRLKKRAAEKKVEWTEVTGPARLRLFLEKAFADAWLGKHFLLFNLEKQFDSVIQNQSSKKINAMPVTDLQYLFERYCEGELDKRLIVTKHYEDLHKKNLVSIDHRIIQMRMKNLLGGNENKDLELYRAYESGVTNKLVDDDNISLMKIAVMEYFKKLKAEKMQMA